MKDIDWLVKYAAITITSMAVAFILFTGAIVYSVLSARCS